MPHVQEVDLTFESLHDLDNGRIAALLKRHLANVAQDCMNRPSDEAARKVTLDFVFKATMDPDSRECERVWCEVECKSKVPVYRSKPIEMRVHRTGFTYNRDFPDTLDQAPLPYEDAADGED